MKTIKLGFCFFLIIILAKPVILMGQNKEMAITTSSKEALKLFLQGREKIENFQNKEAATFFDQAIRQDPDFAMAYLYAAQSGGINSFRPNLDKAISLSDKATAGEKKYILFFQAWVDGNGLKVFENLDPLLKDFLDDKRIQQIAGTYYFSINNFSKAMAYFTRATAIDKNYAPAYNMIGYCQSSLNNFAEAEKAFRQYISLIPLTPNGYDSYAELLLKMGKYDESIAQYKMALERDPAFSFSLVGMGNNYIFKGDYENARKYYQQFADKDTLADAKLQALNLKAISYLYQDETAKAISTLEEEINLAKKENVSQTIVLTMDNQGIILSETGKPDEGIKYVDAAADYLQHNKLPEGDQEALSIVTALIHAFSLIASNELDKASAELEKCGLKIESRKNPNESMFLSSCHALLEIKRGNNDKAMQYFATADQENPFNWFYTGVTYDKKGDKQNAHKYFEKVATCNVNSLNLALVRKRAQQELKKTD
jgi:tetratricopeptide (TPR) repeat protein